MGHEASPVIATRSQLNETRKELMKRDCEDLREKGEELFVPMSVRNAQKDIKEYEFRRPGEEPRTLTVLKDERKREKREYDMANFHEPAREYPRYSDNNDVPFWAGKNVASSSSGHAMAHAVARTVSEPVLKVNEVPWMHETRETHTDMASQAHQPGEVQQAVNGVHYGSKTKKRFSAECAEYGHGRNKPRLFNSLQSIPVGPKDLENLDLTSSLEPVRNAALRAQANDRMASGANPRCSRLWAESQGFDEPKEPKEKAPAADRTQMASKRPLGEIRDSTVETLREPRSYSSPDLRNSATTGVRSGGFHKLDFMSKNTGTRPLAQTKRPSNTRTNPSSSVAPPAPPL